MALGYRVGRIKQAFRELLLSPVFRGLIGRARFFYFVRIKKALRVMNSDAAYGNTVEHNLKGLQDHQSLRMDKLIRPLSCLETVPKTAKVLVLGPRTESDILHLLGCGFQRPNVRGLDLISYSPFVELGDMHEIAHPDNSWDVVLSGWCISYSRTPEVAAREMLRVVKPNGIIGIAVEYSQLDEKATKQLAGYHIGDPGQERLVNSVSDILRLFEGHVGSIFFNHDAPAKQSHSATGLNPNVSAVVVLFSVRK